MVFTVGSTDLTPYISSIKWQRNDVDGSNAGRTLNGEMYRDRVAIKYRWDVSLVPLTAAQLASIMTLIQPEFVTLTYTDPMDNTSKSGTFYSNNVPASFMFVREDGTELWNGVSFPLIQK